MGRYKNVPSGVLRRGIHILDLFDIESPPLDTIGPNNFLAWAENVAHAAQHLTPLQTQHMYWLDDWAIEFRKLYDNFERMRAADPMMCYVPKHSVSEAFHKSQSFIKYYKAGNGTSKTQTGYAEHYMVLTNQHRWRHVPKGGHATFIVSFNYTDYATNTFEKKFVYGEEGNPLSPMFPEGGKWFNRYDRKTYTLTLACPRCAEEGKAGSCRHHERQSTVALFSGQKGPEVIEGGQFLLGHIDEHVPEEWFRAAEQRLIRVPHGQFLITGTPLFGPQAWEIRILQNLCKQNPEENRRYPSQEDSPPYAELFQIDQFQAGIIDHEQINAMIKTADTFTVEARVYGREAPMVKKPVFDRKLLSKMLEECRAPEYCRLDFLCAPLEVQSPDDLKMEPEEPLKGKEGTWTGLRIWEKPVQNGQYLIAADTAKGISKGDASAASVFRIFTQGSVMRSRLVAQYYGWIDMLNYADEIFKLAILYNQALVVVERTGGFGEAVLLRLNRELSYWNLYRDTNKAKSAAAAEDSQYGVDTNMQTKPFMVSLSRQLVNEGRFECQDEETIREMAQFVQEDESSTGQRLERPRFKGAGNTHDDRTMTVVIGLSMMVDAQVAHMLDLAALSIDNTQKESPFWQAVRQDSKTSPVVEL